MNVKSLLDKAIDDFISEHDVKVRPQLVIMSYTTYCELMVYLTAFLSGGNLMLLDKLNGMNIYKSTDVEDNKFIIK